jgi:hypothetical protein
MPSSERLYRLFALQNAIQVNANVRFGALLACNSNRFDDEIAGVVGTAVNSAVSVLILYIDTDFLRLTIGRDRDLHRDGA